LVRDRLGKIFDELQRQGWDRHYFGGDRTPVGLAASKQWEVYDEVPIRWADVVIIHSRSQGAAFRTRVQGDTDLFAPDIVSWQKQGKPIRVIKAVLRLDSPGKRGAPWGYEAPKEWCAVPPDWPFPETLYFNDSL